MKYELKTIKNICDICEIIGIETRKSFKESVRGIAVIRKNNMTKQKEEQKEEWTTIIVIDNGLTYPGASEIAREMRAKWREEFIPPNNCIGYKIATRCLECRTVSYLPTKCCLSCNSNYDNNDHVLIKFNRDNLLETVRNIKVPEDDRWFDLVRFNEYIATGNPQIDVIMSEGGIKEIKYAFFTKEDFLL
jgi:RNA polymerase subunit RPABC4/transcription elongation factor Spt4